MKYLYKVHPVFDVSNSTAAAVGIVCSLLFLICFFQPQLLFAGDKIGVKADGWAPVSPEEEFLFSDEDIIVSAARYRQRTAESPSTVYVITAKEISLSGATNIPELLRSVPGLDVTTLSATEYSVNARGFNHIPANKLLVMIDGRSIYDRTFNVIAWNALPIVLDEIKRIEVVLGPGSALYGANAFSGLINIITKSPEEAAALHLKGTVGNYNAYHHSLLGGGTWKELGWKISAGYDEVSRWREDTKASDMFRCNGVLEYKGKENTRWRLAGGMSKGSTEFFPAPELYLFDTDLDIHYLSLFFQWQGLEIMGAYKRTKSVPSPQSIPPDIDDFLPLPFSPVTPSVKGLFYLMLPAFRQFITNTTDFMVTDLQGQYTFDLEKWCKITLGGFYEYYELAFAALQERPAIQEGSGFLQSVFFPAEGLSITLGGRYDRLQIAEDQWSWRGSLLYSFMAGHSLRFSSGTSFRNPSYSESYFEAKVPFGSVEIALSGNANLKPERITTYEAAYRGLFMDGRTEAQLVIFYNEIEDFINNRVTESLPSNDLPIKIEYINIGRAQALGGEVVFDIKLTDRISTYVNYSFQELRFTKDDPYTRNTDEAGERVTASPRHKVNLGLVAQFWQNFSGNLTGHWVSATSWTHSFNAPIEETVDDYFLLNASFAYRFFKDKAEIAVSGNNLLFTEYREYPLGEEIGSRVLFTLRVDI